MSNNIYDPYDFTVNTLRDNDIRENVVQDALVRLLQACGFDLDRNANVFLSLAASLTKTPDQILTDLKAAGSKNQVVTIDKGNNKLVLIDPVKNTITALEALSNTFSNLVLGITKYTPVSNYSLRVIPGTGTGQPTLGLTDSSGVEHIIATQTDYIALKADVTILKTDVAGLKTVQAQHTTEIAALKSQDAIHSTDIAAIKTDLTSKGTQIMGLAGNLSALNQSALKTITSTGGTVVVTTPASNTVNVEAVPFDAAPLAGDGLSWSSVLKKLQVFISKDSGNSLSMGTDKGIFGGGGGGTAGVSSLNSLAGGLTISKSGVVTITNTTAAKDIAVGVIDAVSEPKTLYVSSTGEDTAPGTSAYAPLKTLGKAIELSKAATTDVITIVPLEDNVSFDTICPPGIAYDHKNLNTSLTNCIVDLKDTGFWNLVAGGKAAKISYNSSITGKTTFVIAPGKATNQSIPTINEFTLSVSAKSFVYSQAQDDSVIKIRALPELTADAFTNTKRININLSIETLYEKWGSTAGANPLISIDCNGFNCQDESHRLDIIVTICIGAFDGAGVTMLPPKAPYIAVLNRDTTKHKYVTVRSTLYVPAESFLFDKTIDPTFASYTALTDQYIASSQVGLPLISATQPFRPIQGATRINNSTTTPTIEAYIGSSWVTIGSGATPSTAKSDNMGVRFQRPLKIDPVAQVLLHPDMEFICAGQDYPDQSSIDLSEQSFIIKEEAFGFRIKELTRTGNPPTVFPKQLLLDDWTGIAGGQSGAFYGIARIKLLDNTTVTVTDNVANTTDIEYKIAFTSTLSLQELNANLLPGLWLELSNVTDAKQIVGVIMSPVTAGTGANNFVLSANLCFTNSKVQASIYTLIELSNKSLSLFLNPFPWVYAQEFKRFRAAVTDGALAHVQQHYFLVAAHSAEVIEEAMLLIPYSASYKALSTKPSLNWDSDIGTCGFSIGHGVSKILVEKLKTVWKETKIKFGFLNMFIPSYCTDTSQSLIGLIVESQGNRLFTSMPFSERNGTAMYKNMPSYWSGLTGLNVVNTKVAAGLQLSSFIDGNSCQLRVAPSAIFDIRLLDTETSAINDSSILASFNSSASNLFNPARALVLDDDVLRIISVYSTSTSLYRPFSNVFITPQTASLPSNFVIYTVGWSTINNSLTPQHHMIYRFNEPDSPVPDPDDADMMLVGNYTEAEGIAQKRTWFIKADGTAIGHLVNS